MNPPKMWVNWIPNGGKKEQGDGAITQCRRKVSFRMDLNYVNEQNDLDPHESWVSNS